MVYELPNLRWNLKTRLIFTSSGLIDEKTNVNKNLSTNKTYLRLKEDNREHIQDEQNGIIDPFSKLDLEEEFGVWD